MNTSSGLQELRQELEQLSQRRERLAGRLTAAADRLDSIGEPPGDDLIDDLNSYRERTLLLAEQLGRWNGSRPRCRARRDHTRRFEAAADRSGVPRAIRGRTESSVDVESR